MKKITAIQVQKRNPNRVNIHLDGEFAFGLTRIVAAWLQVGQTLDEEKIAKLQAEEARERAMQQALLYLSYRARSEKEIRRNLSKHDIPDAVIEETLERLRRDGFANDVQFASAWVENRNTFRPRGRRALTLELRQKGINDSIIESVLENLDEETLAYEAGQKKARKLKGAALPVGHRDGVSVSKGLEWSDFRKKMSDFLARRGFSYSVIAPIVSRLWNETHAEGEAQTIDNEEIA
jgi:regulatory protein